MLESALRVAWKVVLAYVLVVHTIGVVVMFGLLHIKPQSAGALLFMGAPSVLTRL